MEPQRCRKGIWRRLGKGATYGAAIVAVVRGLYDLLSKAYGWWDTSGPGQFHG